MAAMFPKTLPRAAVRRVIQNEKIRREMATDHPDQEIASIKGSLVRVKDRFDIKLIKLILFPERHDSNIQTVARKCNFHAQ